MYLFACIVCVKQHSASKYLVALQYSIQKEGGVSIFREFVFELSVILYKSLNLLVFGKRFKNSHCMFLSNFLTAKTSKIHIIRAGKCYTTDTLRLLPLRLGRYCSTFRKKCRSIAINQMIHKHDKRDQLHD